MATFKFKGLDIFYIINGDITDKNKKVIIILNGIMMNTMSWEQFVEPLSENTVLIRYDMLDQGQSSSLDFEYTQEIQVEVLKALIDHLALKKVNLVAISYGASIALQFARNHQALIDKMVIANVVAKTSPWLKAIGDGWNQVAKTRDGEAYYNITIPYIYSPQFYSKKLDWMENRKKVLIPIFSDARFLNRMTRLTNSASTHDTLKDLKEIKTNTLIISSEEDYLTPVFEQKTINSLLPNSHLVIIPECGHASMYEHPSLFTSLVLGHIVNNKLKYNL